MTNEPSDGNPLRGALDKLSRPPLLTLLAGLLTLGSVLVALVNFANTTGPLREDGDWCCGDFASFWTGGFYVADGRGAALYDLADQLAYQTTWIGKTPESYMPYVYPPILAIVVAPLTWLGYPGAFAGFGLFSSTLLALALALLWPCLDGMSTLGRATACMMVVGFAPVLGTMLGGQTTAITLALFCMHFAAVRRGWPFVAGLMLGLLAYKPQFTLVLGLWHLWRRDWTIVATAVACVAVQYGLGAAVAGPGWPLRFLATARALATSPSWEQARAGFLSLPSAFGYSFGPVGAIVGWLGAALSVAGLVDAARRIGPRDPDVGTLYALMMVVTVLASPYVNYYDNGILALPALLYVNDRVRDGELGLAARLGVGAAWLDYPAWQLVHRLGFQPLALQFIAILGVLLVTCRRHVVPAASPRLQRIG